LPRLSRNEWIALGLVCLSFLWVILQATGQLDKSAQAMGRILPSGFLLFNLFFLPFVTALLYLRLSSHIGVIVAIVLLFLFSWWLIGLSYDRYPVATGAVELLALAQMYWIIPWWRKRRRGEEGAAGTPEPRPATSKAIDYVIYLAIAFAVGGWLIYKVVFCR